MRWPAKCRRDSTLIASARGQGKFSHPRCRRQIRRMAPRLRCRRLRAVNCWLCSASSLLDDYRAGGLDGALSDPCHDTPADRARRVHDHGLFSDRFWWRGILSLLAFDSAQVISNVRFWQIATYAFVHSPSNSSGSRSRCICSSSSGGKWNAFIGRRAFIALYLLLLSCRQCFSPFWGLWQRTGLAGFATIHFGIFVAFAAIYPNVEIFLRVMAKWVALIFVAAYSLQLLAYHRLVAVGGALDECRHSLTASCYCTAPVASWLAARLAFALALETRPSRRSFAGTPPLVEPDNIYDSIDPVLEKISRSGIGSLTASERRALDRARTRC